MKRKIRPLELVMLAAPIILLAIFWWPGGSDREVTRTQRGWLGLLTGKGYRPYPNCASNLKQVGLGIMQYTQDYGQYYPAVSIGSGTPNDPYGWADAIQPYLKETRLFHCSEEGYEGASNPLKRDYTDYWFNRNLAGASLLSQLEIPTLFMGGDGNDGKDTTDARYSISKLPDNWLNEQKSPSKRHMDGAYYLFADGHVKWMTEKNVVNSRIKFFDLH